VSAVRNWLKSILELQQLAQRQINKWRRLVRLHRVKLPLRLHKSQLRPPNSLPVARQMPQRFKQL
jgi:hypothetical protein